MHQLSFSAFAVAQQSPAPVLPVSFENPIALSRRVPIYALRRDFELEAGVGFCLDATRYLPSGGHSSLKLDSCVYVVGTQFREGM